MCEPHQVRHFLEDLDRHCGRYTGFPELGISWQGLESTDMKRSLAMPESLTGVYITGTEPVYHAAKVGFLRVAVQRAVQCACWSPYVSWGVHQQNRARVPRGQGQGAACCRTVCRTGCLLVPAYVVGCLAPAPSPCTTRPRCGGCVVPYGVPSVGPRMHHGGCVPRGGVAVSYSVLADPCD